MPQMAPLTWINLFFIFIMIFLNINSLNYFSFLYKTSKEKLSTNLMESNWKW